MFFWRITISSWNEQKFGTIVKKQNKSHWQNNNWDTIYMTTFYHNISIIPSIHLKTHRKTGKTNIAKLIWCLSLDLFLNFNKQFPSLNMVLVLMLEHGDFVLVHWSFLIPDHSLSAHWEDWDSGEPRVPITPTERSSLFTSELLRTCFRMVILLLPPFLQSLFTFYQR